MKARSGFKKRGKEVVLYKTQKGVKKSTANSQFLISTGCRSLDSIIGGYTIGSVILIEEDFPSTDYLHLFRYAPQF
jgi:hypothetical protein